MLLPTAAALRGIAPRGTVRAAHWRRPRCANPRSSEHLVVRSMTTSSGLPDTSKSKSSLLSERRASSFFTVSLPSDRSAISTGRRDSRSFCLTVAARAEVSGARADDLIVGETRRAGALHPAGEESIADCRVTSVARRSNSAIPVSSRGYCARERRKHFKCLLAHRLAQHAENHRAFVEDDAW